MPGSSATSCRSRVAGGAAYTGMSVALRDASELNQTSFGNLFGEVAFDLGPESIKSTCNPCGGLNQIQRVKLVQEILEHSYQMLRISWYNSIAHIIPKNSTPIFMGLLR